MNNFSLLKTSSDPEGTINSVLAGLLKQDLVQAVLAPARPCGSSLPMPTLFGGSEDLKHAVPLAPAAGVSAASLAARISRGSQDYRTAVLLRPCEIRALVELHKLNQACMDNLVVIGLECLGRLENQTYLELCSENDDLDRTYYRDPEIQARAAGTCLSCKDFMPENFDLSFCVLGLDLDHDLGIAWKEGHGKDLAGALELSAVKEPEQRSQAIEERLADREAARQELLHRTLGSIQDMDRFQDMISNCLGCFNCQRACPVCFCRECVCSREAFDQDPGMLHARASGKGGVRLPGDLTMFHLTRLVHMSHACVGCGQCTSACPSRIPLADIFRTAGDRVQQELKYEPGRSPEDPIPYVDFAREDRK